MPVPVPPSSLLLASDLSARCDRALDRALLLARQWNARLVVATVLPSLQELDFHDQLVGTPPWQRPTLLAERIGARLRRELGDPGVTLQVCVETGAVGPALLQVAQREGCGLILAGVAPGSVFAQPRLGSTVSWLTRHTHRPLLVVHRRPRDGYRSMVLATDYSAVSRHALDTALALFGEPMTLALLHGYEAAHVGARDSHPQAALAAAQALAERGADELLATLPGSAALRQRATVIAARGDPARLLRDFVRDHDSELAVVGCHGRSALMGLLLGDVAGRILASVQTDLLLVRSPRVDDAA